MELVIWDSFFKVLGDSGSEWKMGECDALLCDHWLYKLSRILLFDRASGHRRKKKQIKQNNKND